SRTMLRCDRGSHRGHTPCAAMPFQTIASAYANRCIPLHQAKNYAEAGFLEFCLSIARKGPHGIRTRLQMGMFFSSGTARRERVGAFLARKRPPHTASAGVRASSRARPCLPPMHARGTHAIWNRSPSCVKGCAMDVVTDRPIQSEPYTALARATGII